MAAGAGFCRSRDVGITLGTGEGKLDATVLTANVFIADGCPTVGTKLLLAMGTGDAADFELMLAVWTSPLCGGRVVTARAESFIVEKHHLAAVADLEPTIRAGTFAGIKVLTAIIAGNNLDDIEARVQGLDDAG